MASLGVIRTLMQARSAGGQGRVGRDGANQERANDGPALKVGEFAFHDVRKVVLNADSFKPDTASTSGASSASNKPAEKPPEKPADKPAESAKAGEAAKAADKILEKAKAITANNGVDEIFFRTENGDLYVAAFRGSANDVKTGYLGRFGGQKVEVVHVDDESNTFWEGVKGTFSWTDSAIKNVAGQEVTKALGTVVGTIAGGLIAAAALKGTGAAPVATAAVAAANPAVAAAANTAAAAVAEVATGASGAAAVTAGKVAGGTAAGTVVVNAAKTGATAVRSALSGAMRTVVMVGVPVAVIAGIVFGTGAVIGGLKATRRRANFGTLDMVTDQF